MEVRQSRGQEIRNEREAGWYASLFCCEMTDSAVQDMKLRHLWVPHLARWVHCCRRRRLAMVDVVVEPPHSAVQKEP